MHLPPDILRSAVICVMVHNGYDEKIATIEADLLLQNPDRACFDAHFAGILAEKLAKCFRINGFFTE